MKKMRFCLLGNFLWKANAICEKWNVIYLSRGKNRNFQKKLIAVKYQEKETHNWDFLHFLMYRVSKLILIDTTKLELHFKNYVVLIYRPGHPNL